ELRFGEPGVVVTDERLERRVGGITRLYQDFARLLAPARAAAHLGEGREKASRRAVVGGKQRAVGVQYAHQRQVRKIVAFGEQLRAHQDVAFATADAVERARKVRAPAGAVAVDAHDACRGK